MEAQAHARQAALEALVFELGGEEYAVDILKVQEIRGYDKVKPIPRSPDYLKGMINLRGVVVPVLDLRVRFGIAEPRYDAFTVMVILRIAARIVAVVVDGVSDVVRLPAHELKPAPTLGSVVDSSFIAGVATPGDRMVLLLDIEKLLSSGELRLIETAAGEAASATAE